jgi:hypothetical protein
MKEYMKIVDLFETRKINQKKKAMKKIINNAIQHAKVTIEPVLYSEKKKKAVLCILFSRSKDSHNATDYPTMMRRETSLSWPVSAIRTESMMGTDVTAKRKRSETREDECAKAETVVKPKQHQQSQKASADRERRGRGERVVEVGRGSADRDLGDDPGNGGEGVGGGDGAGVPGLARNREGGVLRQQ